MANAPEPWVPSSKEEWEDVFAGGFRKVLSERDEAETQRAAADAAKDKGEGGDSDSDGNGGFTWAKRLLG